jgi:hypothetical protein
MATDLPLAPASLQINFEAVETQVPRLSLAKRTAVIECFNNSGLHKRNGSWRGSPKGKQVSGVTVADLARDGMFSLSPSRPFNSVRLTARGEFFARKLVGS